MWPFNRKVEKRQQGYTDALLNALLVAAQGGELSKSALTTAVLEAAAGLWSRCFASATVTPSTAAAVLTPENMALVGRSLIRSGESAWHVSLQNNMRRIVPISINEVSGSWYPDTWRYQIGFPSPSGEYHQETVLANEILHFRYGRDPERPWRGLSPMGFAPSTAEIASASEQRMAEESAAPTGYVLPVPDDASGSGTDADGDVVDPLAPLRTQLGGLKGKLALVQSTSGGWEEGRTVAPQSDWSPKRLGADPPASLVQLRESVQKSVLIACGIPPGMWISTEGATAREAFRQFLHGSLKPVANMVRDEARDKLAIPDLEFDFDSLFASDIQGRARAFQSLVGGGMDIGKAAAVTGILLDE